MREYNITVDYLELLRKLKKELFEGDVYPVEFIERLKILID